jgi:subtilisin
MAARLLPLLLVAALVVDDGSTAIMAQQAETTEDIVVVLPPGVNVGGVLRDFDIRPSHRFDKVVNGFAAEVPPGIRRALERIPGAIVSPNRRVEATAQVTAEKRCKQKDKKKRKRCKKRQNPPPAPVAPAPAPQSQTVPTGIRRIAADQNPQAAIRGDGGAIDVDVAVLDSGIAAHPDLTIAGGTACTGEGTGDGDGHGTHVAGTIGAQDNGFGVVGVAPGARLYAVKVLNNQSVGDYESIICGLDWVVDNANTIDIVNMSLGGSAPETTCLNGALHAAVCNTILAGVTVVVAAGNEAEDASGHFPANYDEVITVSALTDFNGRPGGQAASTCYSDGDDTFARYSNFGAEVDITAPGTCILSTWPGGAYETLLGTSMATPHVTGAALYIAVNQAATPVDVRAYLLGPTGSRPQQFAEGLVVDDDPDAIPEPVLYIPIGAP